MNPPQLRISTLAAEGPMQASKWLQSQVLLSSDEMTALFAALGNFDIFQTSSVLKQDEGRVSHKVFLKCYKAYVDALQQGKTPEESSYKLFSAVFTADPDSLYAALVGDDKQLIRVCRPVIQLQAHRMDYSSADGKFRSMTFGTDSIFWGIQFSYPQLFQDKQSLQIKQATNAEFINAGLFQKLQRWVRHHTAPTPFIVNGVKVNVPMRLGKECFAWINQHPQLNQRGLIVS